MAYSLCRRAGFCLRHLRVVDAPADRATGAGRTAQSRSRNGLGQRPHSRLDELSDVGQRHFGGRVWVDWRVAVGPLWPPARADLEHFRLRALAVRRRLHALGADAPGPALHDVHWRVCGIRRRGGLAGRVVPQSQAAGKSPRLHAGVCLSRRLDGRGSLLLVRVPRAGPARDSCRSFAVALHAHFGTGPGGPAHVSAAVFAGVAGVEGEAGPGAFAAAQLRRTVPAGIAANDAGYRAALRLRLRRGLWRDSIDAANRSWPGAWAFGNPQTAQAN